MEPFLVTGLILRVPPTRPILDMWPRRLAIDSPPLRAILVRCSTVMQANPHRRFLVFGSLGFIRRTRIAQPFEAAI